MQQIADDTLDSYVSKFASDHPNTGEALMKGYMLSSGYKVPRAQLRRSIYRVDSVGRNRRRNLNHPIPRREYDVTIPNELWHADQHEKLPGRMFFIFGIVDGASRKLLALRVSDEKHRWTVYDMFMDTICQYNLPSRLRVDAGSENGYMNSAFMTLRGYKGNDNEENNPLIIGRSVHNIKIEHQWLFVRKNVVDNYRDLYDRLKTEHYIFPRHNECTPTQKYIFTYLLLTRIEQDLNQYMGIWNAHPIRTLENKSSNIIYEVRQKVEGISEETFNERLSNFFDETDLEPDLLEAQRHPTHPSIIRPTKYVEDVFHNRDEMLYFEECISSMTLQHNFEEDFFIGTMLSQS